MSRPRILYVDVPFEHEPGGDKNRSRFLWQTLGAAFDTDLLLITPPGFPAGRQAFTRFQPVLSLAPGAGPRRQSDSVFAFAPADLDRFRRLLDERRYDAVFARFHSPWVLAGAAAAHATRPAVVMDLDMLSSRLVGLTWRQARSWRNRWFLFEKWKLEALESSLLKQPFLILLSNPEELAHLRDQVAPRPCPARLAVLPNMMPPAPALPSPAPGDATTPPAPLSHKILFFGSLNSGANTDAFRYLVTTLLPLLDADLHRHGVTIEVVGKNPPDWFGPLLTRSGSNRVVLVGGVDSMERAIAESRFVFLPLRVASGTRTRILEAAAVGRGVVTTPIGAEGIETGDGALIANDPAGLAAAVRSLLEDPARAEQLGARLKAACLARYAAERVATDLVRDVASFLATRPRPAA